MATPGRRDFFTDVIDPVQRRLDRLEKSMRDINLGGGPGGGSDATYVHTQSVAATVWTINHPLEKRPSITVADTAGTVHQVGLRYVDDDTVEVTWAVPMAGVAYLN